MMEICLEPSVVSPNRLLDVYAKNILPSIKPPFCKQFLEGFLRYTRG